MHANAKSRSRWFGRCLGLRWLICSAALVWGLAQAAAGCPFCTSLKPTLTQRREAASVVVLGEFLERDGKHAVFRSHQFLEGKSLLGGMVQRRQTACRGGRPR